MTNSRVPLDGPPSTPDKRALRILFSAFWDARGWKTGGLSNMPLADFTYARAKGVMFDEVMLDHADTQRRLSAVLAQLDNLTVADAFLASLSTRRLEWRSAFGSYLVFHAMPKHAPEEESRCDICGIGAGNDLVDLNVLSFERFKWSGVRHTDPTYAMFDLEQFCLSPAARPTQDDARLLLAILDALTELPPGITSTQAERCLASVFKSNKYERRNVLSMLGYAGILRTPYPAFVECYHTPSRRPLPPSHFVEMPYPACWWRSEYGIDHDRVTQFFGHIL